MAGREEEADVLGPLRLRARQALLGRDPNAPLVRLDEASPGEPSAPRLLRAIEHARKHEQNDPKRIQTPQERLATPKKAGGLNQKRRK